VSTYTFVATNALTGAVMSQNLPLVVNRASMAINGVGQLDGYLPLQQDSRANRAFVKALVPDHTMLWMLQDNYPIWAGIFADSNHSSIKNHQYPITAYTPESILAARQIRTALSFTNVDVLDIARGLVDYGFSPDRGPNAGLANLVLSTRTAGQLASQTFGVSNTLTAGGNTYTGSYSSNQAVEDALSTFADAAVFEYNFAPRLNGNALQILFRLGYPAIGRYNAPAVALLHPGAVIDYARPVLRSKSANDIQGTASANNTGNMLVSQPGHGLDSADLSQGHILRQTSVTWPGSGAISQAQVNQWTDTQIARFTAGTMVPSVVLGGGTQPSLTQIGLGDAVNFAATSDLDPADPKTKAPGLQLTARIAAWSLQPPGPNGQAEELTLTFGALVGSTGIGGVGIA
jgi:hypothetical protein